MYNEIKKIEGRVSMEEIIKVCVDNGIGIASFLFLMLFIFKYQEKNNETMKKMCDTMVQMQINMATMTDRLDKIEEKINRKEVS